MKEAVDKVKEINEIERILGEEQSEYGTLDAYATDFAPFFRLWSAMSDFDALRDQCLREAI